LRGALISIGRSRAADERNGSLVTGLGEGGQSVANAARFRSHCGWPELDLANRYRQMSADEAHLRAASERCRVEPGNAVAGGLDPGCKARPQGGSQLERLAQVGITLRQESRTSGKNTTAPRPAHGHLGNCGPCQLHQPRPRCRAKTDANRVFQPLIDRSKGFPPYRSPARFRSVPGPFQALEQQEAITSKPYPVPLT